MTGALLTDKEIVEAIEGQEIIITELDPKYRIFRSGGPIQPCSLDLMIGEILLPPGNSPSSNCEKSSAETGFRLEPGHTAVVVTKEKLKLSPRIGGFGFPPASVSRNAILMTNPGHVDPGFSGHLTFTLINMGRSVYSLKRGDPLVTLLLFRFDEPVQVDYATRRQNAKAQGAAEPDSRENVLNRLAVDFAAYSDRIDQAVEKAVIDQLSVFENRTSTAEQKLDRAKLIVPTITGLIGVAVIAAGTFGTLWFGYAKEEAVESLKDRVISLESTLDIETVKARLMALEELQGGEKK